MSTTDLNHRQDEEVVDSAVLPILPVKNSVLFPHLVMPLVVSRAASIRAVEEAVSTEEKKLVVVSQKAASVETPTLEDLFHVGTLATVQRMDRRDNAVPLIVVGQARVLLLRAEEETPLLRARVRELPWPEDEGIEVEALHREIMDQASRIMELVNPEAQAGLTQIVSEFPDPLNQVYLMASMLPIGLEKEQALLAANTRVEALRLMHQYITHQAQVFEVQHKIASQAQSEMGREQREYLLRQQLRAIQDELGEGGSEQTQMADLTTRLSEASLPDAVRKEAERELNRLERIPTASPEHQLTRTYVELLIELPWSRTTDDLLDLDRAQRVLDEDHYDLEDVKERIIEHLAVLKMNPQAKSPILCFVGPPGVGKTSLGKSIARSLGRRFERMSLGGLHDEAELRGHRRTYIGAMPGRILQAIRRAGVKNPLLMLDEVDKVGHDFRGDPASALLEILDPAQNYEFRDNYLDLPFDLSEVFFITTANTLDTIPAPLLDRMETLRLAGYSDEEKMHIARQYLIPRQLQENGLTGDRLTIPDQTASRIIHRYTREAGVRELERTLGRLCRKVATRFAKGQTDPVTAGPEDLTELLGPERFFQEVARKDLPPGVAAGLAYTPVGGDVLYVETLLLPKGTDVKLTGKLGDVMKESAEAARSYVQAWAARMGVPPNVFQRGVHIHVPAGATPKDGPSAGVALAAALASLLVQRPVRSDTAMTGEITLSGLILPVGGIKEKVLAAYRSRIRRVILPEQNEKDLDKLPGHVKQKLEFVFVGRIEEALAAAIPNLPVAKKTIVEEPIAKKPVAEQPSAEQRRLARRGVFPAVDE
jgi:ATP-dependent Lon protease